MWMKHYRRWIKRAVCLLAGLLFLVNTNIVTYSADRGRVLRVAFPELEGISETDQYGNHTGLLVDYLNEIAKYTRWEYEYIPVENEEVVTNFLEGQYDLMGGTFYSSGFEEYFAYPDYNTGWSRAVLLCRRADESLLGYDLTSLNGKVIGVYENAVDKIRDLKEFLKSNDLDCQLKYYSYEDMGGTGNLYRQLRDGEVDMLLGNDQEIHGEFRMVTSFKAQPYYIVTNLENTEVLDGLNKALRYILESTPNFADEVYSENFPDVKMADIQLNDQESRYIEEKGTVTVAVPGAFHPLSCKNSPIDHHAGMLPELWAAIHSFTGLEVRFIYADTYAGSIQMVQQGKADVLGAYLEDDSLAFSEDLALTQPFISLSNMVLKHKSVSYPEKGLTCGLLTGCTLASDLDAEEIQYFDTVPDMLAAVNCGEVDYIYGISAALEQEMQRRHYMNVVPVTQVSNDTSVSFALAQPIEPEMLTILNKAIANITTSERNAILKRNLISLGYTNLSFREMIYANPVEFILLFGCLLLLIMTVVLLIIRSRTKNALMQSRLEAAEARSVAKSDFLSRMSHEIRTPMNAIIGLTELAILEQDDPQELKRKLKKILSSTQYMVSLINDILDMSRIENGKVEIEQREFLLTDVLEGLEDMMAPQAEKKGLNFERLCRFDHKRVVGDPLRLLQVLTNLLSNAIKFTPAGGAVTLRVEETACDGETAEYRFSVKDTGDGIAKEDQERIFTAFEQLNTYIDRSVGTGLGLPISRNIVELMGGELLVDSEIGKGAEFYTILRFPLAAGDAPAQPESEAEEKSLDGVRVLLAEDNDLNAEIAQELLSMQGVLVQRAVNGQEAVEMFCSSAPGEFKAILMDIMMPVMNGHEAARAIRSSGRTDASVPIIAMTANSFRADEEAALDAGMNGFVPKPVDVGYLFTVLREFI